MITLKNVSKSYKFNKKERISVLKNVDCVIQDGEIVTILGPSGSGKSTLLNLMSGVDVADDGEIIIGEINIAKCSESQRTELRLNTLGFVFQSYQLIETLNMYDNVILPILAAGRDVNKNEVENLLKRLCLYERRFHFPHQLSGGEQQRTAIARTFIKHPKIVFADEPTGNLDANNTMGILNLLSEEAKNTQCTLIIVSHDKVFENISDRILVLQDGRLSE